MADQADVENALVALVTAALYPTGVSGPTSVSPIVGTVVAISRGWPDPQSLDDALAAGISYVSVYPPPGMTRLTTRYAPTWQQLAVVAPTVTATAAGATVTLGGAAGAGQVVGLQFGQGRLESGYSYRLTGADTLATAAAGLAAKVAGATAAGPVITLAGAPPNLFAAVVSDQAAQIEVRRQAQEFRIICWCPTPAARDTLSAAVDLAMACLTDVNGNLTQFITLQDGTAGYTTFRNGYTMDGNQKDGLWRRDLCYTVEYPTTLIQAQPELLFLVENVVANGQPVTRIGVVDFP